MFVSMSLIFKNQIFSVENIDILREEHSVETDMIYSSLKPISDFLSDIVFVTPVVVVW